MQKTVLIIDDDPDNRILLSRFVTEWGYRAETAAEGKTGLAKLRDINPSLVLLDLIMPGMDGLQFLKSARELRPELAVIVISGVDDEEIAKRAMTLGAVDYLVKPFVASYLENSVRAKLAAIIR